MNIKYFFVVSLCFFMVFPKNSTAQEEIDLDITSIDDYSFDENSSSFFEDDFLDDQNFDEENPQVITSSARSLQTTSPRNIYTDDFKYRWYIQAGAGAQFLMGEDDSKGPFKSRLTLAPSITGGYRWNPIFGVRLNLTGGSLHGYNDGNSGTYRFWKGKSNQEIVDLLESDDNTFPKLSDFAGSSGINDKLKAIRHWDPQWNYLGFTKDNGLHHDYHQGGINGWRWNPGQEGTELYMQHLRYIAASAALTVNLMNLIGGADDSRKFDVSMHLGPSAFHVLPHIGTKAYTGFGVNGGIQGQYHINDKFGVYAEFSGHAMPDGFDGHYGGDTFDLIGQAVLGVSYKFAADKWEMPKQTRVMETTPEVDDELSRIRAELTTEIDQMVDLQPEIDRLRAQLAELQVKEEVVKEVPVKESFFLPNPAHFQIGKSDIDAQAWTIIEDVAAYLNTHPDASVIVTGYADKDTGTASINERLSRERSMKVADALHYRYNIPQSRIAIDWRGDKIQPFFRNQMNRAVLFYIEFDN